MVPYVYEIASICLFVVLSLIVSIFILHSFTSRHKPPFFILLILLYSYTLSLSALSLLSVDVADGLYNTRQGLAESPRYLQIVWKVFYWSIQLLAWVFLPVCQSYLSQGHFTWYRKLLGAIVANILLYFVFGIFGLFALIALLIWLVSRSGSGMDLFGSCIALSNIIGLVMLIVLMGYGIAKLPKYMWHRGNYKRTLSQYHFRAANIYDELDDAKEDFKNLLVEIRTLASLSQIDDENRKYIDKLALSVQKDFARFSIEPLPSMKRRRYTYKQLVKLHSKVIIARRRFKAASYQWEWLQKKIFFTEAIIDAKTYATEWKIESPFKKSYTGRFATIKNVSEYLWFAHLRPLMLRAFSILFFIFAIILLFCECSILLQQDLFKWMPNISLFALIKYVRHVPYAMFVLQGISLAIMCLMTYIVFFGLFKLRIFKLYVLIPHHSDAASLLFAAVVLTRVVPALCYNYLQLLGITTNDGVAYFDVMGSQKLEVKILGGFGTLFQYNFPIFIIIVAILTLFDVPDRIGALFSIERFVYDTHEEGERIREGKEIVAAAKRIKLLEFTNAERSEGTPLSAGSPIYESDNDTHYGLSGSFQMSDFSRPMKVNPNTREKKGGFNFKLFGKSQKPIYDDDDNVYSL